MQYNISLSQRFTNIIKYMIANNNDEIKKMMNI